VALFGPVACDHGERDVAKIGGDEERGSTATDFWIPRRGPVFPAVVRLQEYAHRADGESDLLAGEMDASQRHSIPGLLDFPGSAGVGRMKHHRSWPADDPNFLTDGGDRCEIACIS